MQNLSEIFAGKPGVDVKNFCSFCTQAATGTLDFGDGVPVPCCLDCAGVIATDGLPHDDRR
jgi:hypothetical protein